MEPNFFWSTNRRIKKYINALRIDSAIYELRILRISSAHRFIFNFFLIFFTVRLKSNDILGFNLSELGKFKEHPPREPQGIEIGPSFSAEGYNPLPPQKESTRCVTTLIKNVTVI
jgi:hypothetical protein